MSYYAVLWLAGLVAIAVVFEIVGRVVQAVTG